MNFDSFKAILDELGFQGTDRKAGNGRFYRTNRLFRMSFYEEDKYWRIGKTNIGHKYFHTNPVICLALQREELSGQVEALGGTACFDKM